MMIYDLALILIVSTFLAIMLWRFKQPPILAYILAGALIGKSLIKEYFYLFSDLGVAFLLFIVGIELSLNKIKHLGIVSTVIGIGQIVFTGFFGYLLCFLLGFSHIQSLYVSIALTFSSTIIIVKLLSEKNDLDTLYGRIAVGFLLVQDFFAVLVLLFLGIGTSSSLNPSTILRAIFSGVELFALSFLLGRYILPRIFNSISKSQELLFLSSISWCLLFMYVAHLMNFSVQIGAFLAGISLASLPFSYEISAKIRPLRDFFVVLFFVLLGTQLSLKINFSVFILSLFVLIGNPIIVYLLMIFLGYRKRTSFLASLATAQISEFSLILASLGVSLGHISQETFSMITTVGAITIAISSYMIIFSEKLYKIFSPFLFERKVTVEKFKIPKNLKNHIILIGCHRLGYSILEFLKEAKKRFVVIDFNPEIIKMLEKNNVAYIYGDATDTEILEKANIKKSILIISTIPSLEENIFIVKKAKSLGKYVITTANHLIDAKELYNAGADYVILPHFLGGEKVKSLLQNIFKDMKIINKIKNNHINYLEKRKRLGHY
jgi:Kef-type K+ transport system membrane component KefB